MIADIDIWRTARLLMRQRDEPEFYAAQRADELYEAGDLVGSRVWQRIVFAIRNLAERSPVCPVCRNAKWVCESHADRPWKGERSHVSACECGAGAPCPMCNQGEPPDVQWDGKNGG